MDGGTQASARVTVWSWLLYLVALAAGLVAAGLMVHFIDWGNRLLSTAELPPERLDLPAVHAAVIAIAVGTVSYLAACRLRTPPRLVVVLFPPLACALGYLYLFTASMIDQIANIGLLHDDSVLVLVLLVIVFLPPAILIWLFSFGKYSAGIGLGDLRGGSSHALLWLLFMSSLACTVGITISAVQAWPAPSGLGGVCVSLLWLNHIWSVLVGRAHYFAGRKPKAVNNFAPIE